MKVLKVLFICLPLILFFADLVIAQTNSVQDSKARTINSQLFLSEEIGIKDLVKIYSRLGEEFKQQEQEIKVLTETHNKLVDEVKQLAEKGKYISLPEKAINEKTKEHDSSFNNLQNKIKLAKSGFEEREKELTKEINKKIAVALKQFAKENEYSAIVDISKIVLVENGFSISLNDSLDVTKEFIKFYNERFAGKKQ